MKHTKKILALAMSVAVVASIAAAGTLAYLTSGTQTVTNKFSLGTDTKGQVAITLDEKNLGEDAATNPRTTTGNDYTNLLPGKELEKDPTVKVSADSFDSYLFVAVKNDFGKGVDDEGNEIDVAQFQNQAKTAYGDLETAITGQGWVKVDSFPSGVTAPTGYTIYVKATANGYTKVEANTTHVVFDGMRINPDLASLVDGNNASLINDKTVVIKAFAIQADNLGENAQTVALTEAVASFNK